MSSSRIGFDLPPINIPNINQCNNLHAIRDWIRLTNYKYQSALVIIYMPSEIEFDLPTINISNINQRNNPHTTGD
jgi:hypothetical protein